LLSKSKAFDAKKVVSKFYEISNKQIVQLRKKRSFSVGGRRFGVNP
jgi:hypothetical protein